MAKMSFKELINSDTPVLVDFFATWCGPCKMMAPILDQLKDEVGEHARILKIDIDKNEAAANAYEIQSVPTLMVFKNGEILWRKSGTASVTELKKALQV